MIPTQINFQVLERSAYELELSIVGIYAGQAQERRLKALAKAKSELIDNPFYFFENGELTILSRFSNKLYTVPAQGQCWCEAGSYGRPCYHVAMRDVLKIYEQFITPANAAAVASLRPQPLGAVV